MRLFNKKNYFQKLAIKGKQRSENVNVLIVSEALL